MKTGQGKTDPGLWEELLRLRDRYRDSCLWFLKEDVRPETPEAARRMLGYIERYGDREAFIQARRLKKCLLRNSSATYAG